MITMNKFHKIRQLKNVEGLSQRQIAARLKIDRKTVKKYLDSSSPPKYPERESSTKVDPTATFTKRIETLAKNPKNLAVDIYEVLVSEGYTGSERTLRRRVNELRARQDKERFFDQEYEPADQSQFDFKETFSVPFNDGIKVMNLHFGTLPYSNIFFISAYFRKTYECFIEGIHQFFEVIGGQTHEQRIDNLSPCVSKVHQGKRRTYTDSFQKAIDYYNFNINPCRPGKGNDKGDVERDIRTHARRIERRFDLEGITFDNVDELNQWLANYCRQKWTDSQKQKLKSEQAKLLPLLTRDPAIMYRQEYRKIGPTGIIQLGDYFYSVPNHAIGSWCEVSRTPHKILIKDNSNPKVILATHDREYGSSIKLEHVLPSLVLKPGAMLRWAHQKVLFPRPIFKAYYQRLKKQCHESAEREFLRTLNLIQHATLDEIQAALELAMESTESQDFYQVTKDLVLGDRPSSNIIFMQEHKQDPFDVNLSSYNELIPQPKSGENL